MPCDNEVDVRQSSRLEPVDMDSVLGTTSLLFTEPAPELSGEAR